MFTGPTRRTRGFTLFTLLVVVTGCSATLAAHPHHRWQEQIHWETDHAAPPGSVLDIEVGDSDIELRTTDTRRVRIRFELSTRGGDEEWAREVFEKMNVRSSVEGSTIRVRANDPRISRRSDGSNWGFWGRFVIEHPEELEVSIVTGDGDVRVDAVRGKLSIRTSDGDVTVKRARGSEIALDTSDGDILVGAMECESAVIGTGDGDVSIEEMTGRLLAKTGDGDIHIAFDGREDATIRTGDGDVFVELLQETGIDLDLSGGEIAVRGEATISGLVSDTHVRGQLNGGGKLLRVQTGDGDIVLRR